MAAYLPFDSSVHQTLPIASTFGVSRRRHAAPSSGRPRQDSNLRTRLRRPVLYPLSYEGGPTMLPPRVLVNARGARRMARMPAVRVLVVDDDPVIQKLLQVNFEMEGYSVITASDGVEGLERARAERPDIVILDVMMPKMNGLEVASALKGSADTAGIPII